MTTCGKYMFVNKRKLGGIKQINKNDNFEGNE